MNRKERRAALKQKSSTPRAVADGAPKSIAQMFEDAVRLQHEHKLDDAVAAYKRVLQFEPDHAEACNNLGVVLMAQSKRAEASAYFARSLALVPQLTDQFAAICHTMVSIAPSLNDAMRRAVASWPKRLSIDELFDRSDFNAVTTDPLLLHVLRSTPVREVALERLLTSLRGAIVNHVLNGEAENDSLLTFCCALAEQCFINEYIFDVTDVETTQLDRLKVSFAKKLEAAAAPPPLMLAVIAMYEPLHESAWAQRLLDQTWPSAVAAVVTQQVQDVFQERALRSQIPRLTPINDEVSQVVRQQYEENPYPRWVDVATNIEAVSLDQHLRDLFQTAAFTPLGKTDFEMLVAGCGTGRHCMWIAQRFQGSQLLAVDLSLSSLCFAKRKTPPALADRITYAQADILKLPAIGRTFDAIDASGVLHHMAEPFEAWRLLLKLLQPEGFMHVCLYSELGRQDVVAARTWIAERELEPSPANIRRCRQDLLETPLRSLTRFNDYFGMSECRDLLFHVQEHRTTIPAIKAFLAENKLRFLGFAFDHNGLQKYQTLFADNRWSMTDLDRWHEVETKYPDTFSGMYQLWAQKI